MKHKKILIAFGLAAGLFMNTGCDPNFEEINIDPTKLSPATMDYHLLFTSAQLITSGNSDGNGYEDWRNNLIYGSTMIQHLSSTTGYWAGDKYLYNPGYNSAYWDNNYPNSIRNIVDAVENVKDKPELNNFYQIARIFKVFQFQRMTDMYGDIPYFQAGKGYVNGIFTPEYDPQEEIYDHMLNELKDAAENLDESALNTVGTQDLMYQGDVAKWKKFAYSEMVRLAMRLSKVNPSKAEQWVGTAFAGGVMTTNEDNALIQHQALASQNPINNGTAWILAGQDPNATRISETFINILKSTDDPRLPFIATVATNPGDVNDKGNNDPDIQLGQPNGYDLSAERGIANAPNWPGNQNLYSIVNRNTFARFDAPTFLLTAGETQLLLAEAAQRNWIAGDPATFYNAGVTLSILQLNQTGATLTEGDATTYLAANPFDPANALEQINTQYYIVTFLDEYEAWANWRRSGFPDLVPVAPYPGNVTNGTIPRRFTYPSNEVTVNPTNYATAVSRLSDGDKMTSRVWWDVE